MAFDRSASARRARLRRAMVEAGPDAGRVADHLKLRSDHSEALLRRYEAPGIGWHPDQELSRRDGDGGWLVFLYGLSPYGGEDCYGG